MGRPSRGGQATGTRRARRKVQSSIPKEGEKFFCNGRPWPLINADPTAASLTAPIILIMREVWAIRTWCDDLDQCWRLRSARQYDQAATEGRAAEGNCDNGISVRVVTFQINDREILH